MNKVVFYEDGHVYKRGRKKLTSVSAFLSHFTPEFKRKYWLDVGALKALIPDFAEQKKQWKYSGHLVYSDEFIDYFLKQVDILDFIHQRELLEQKWDAKRDKSCEDGTSYHLDQENASYERGFEINPFDAKEYVVHPKPVFDKGQNQQLVENYFDLPDGYYPELLIAYKDLAGQADRIFIGTDDYGRYVDVDDYKTVEKVDRKGFFNEDTRRNETLLPPISHLENCNYIKHSLQVSCYAWMLYQYGFQVRNTAFHHFLKMYKTHYMRREVEDAFKVYFKQ